MLAKLRENNKAEKESDFGLRAGFRDAAGASLRYGEISTNRRMKRHSDLTGKVKLGVNP
jgi:hypothetical protein